MEKKREFLMIDKTNRAILDDLKRRVIRAYDTWVNELPSILWASQIILKAATGESPFSLAFGTEIVLPPKVIFPTPQVENFGSAMSESKLRAGLDLIEERRANAHLRALAYRRVVARLYN